MTKSEWKKMVKKESTKIVKKLHENPHELSWVEAMMLTMGLIVASEEKAKLKKDKNNN